MNKGSYYNNPLVDHPDVASEEKAAHPMSARLAHLSDAHPPFQKDLVLTPLCCFRWAHRYYSDNVWPEKDEAGVEGFEEAFKE